MVPWSDLTGNRIKDFNLFEDLFPTEKKIISEAINIVDPELASLLSESEETPAEPDSTATAADTVPTTPAAAPAKPKIQYAQAPVADDGTVLIETYTPDGLSLPHFKSALGQADSRVVRVAVLGDSYIEGDIFCQDLRRLLQRDYGGEGVGFVAMHTDFPGFRGSVTQSSSGWEMHDIRKMSRKDSLRTLSGDYAKASSAATSTYKGTKSQPTWSRGSFMFISADTATITLKADGTAQTFAAQASTEPQLLTVNGPMKEFVVKAPAGTVALGAYLDGNNGVQVDCMSIRGNSGLSLGRLAAPLCSQMRSRGIDYDLIVLEFGMNILNAEQDDYSAYGKAMIKAVEHLKRIYPNADILIMGVGDRGIKNGTEIVSMASANALTATQRDIAQQTATHFWDTRAAMGGDGAAKKWRTDGYLNADYIHLNHKGGAHLADLFYNSLSLSLK